MVVAHAGGELGVVVVDAGADRRGSAEIKRCSRDGGKLAGGDLGGIRRCEFVGVNTGCLV